jgi:type I restriction enzyme S subunit
MKISTTQKSNLGGWKLVKMSECLVVKHGKSQKEIEVPGGKYPILASGGAIGWTDTPIYSKPSVLIGRKGTIDKPRYIETPFWTVDTLFYTQIKSGFSAKYLYYKFWTINWKLYNESSGLPSLSASAISSIIIYMPPLPEQNRIVAVLETWDRAIEKLSRKIETKKEIKKGLMQGLLTGGTRLPGFRDKWETVKLGEICKITTGKKDVNEGNPDGLYPFFTCAKEHTYSDNYSFDAEAILIAGNGEVGNCLYYKGKFEAYQRTYVLTSFKNTALYVFPYLKFFFQNIINSQKQMGAMPYIKLGMLKDFQINIPKSSLEQVAIANVLVSSEEDIKKLQQKLSLLRDQKKYLLDNLITGTIRTPENMKIK